MIKYFHESLSFNQWHIFIANEPNIFLNILNLNNNSDFSRINMKTETLRNHRYMFLSAPSSTVLWRYLYLIHNKSHYTEDDGEIS